MKQYYLFLDDERIPADCSGYDITFICKTVEDAQNIIFMNDHNEVEWMISFDHDLGTEKTGKHFADWIIERDMKIKGFWDRLNFYVHSQNPIGKSNIEGVLASYNRSRN